jgi:hypothetical protein
MAIVKQEYLASSGLSVSGLNSLPGSISLLSGWISDNIDNSVNKCLDYTAAAQFTKAASGIQVGQIQVWVIPELADGSWPNILSSGTFGVEGRAVIIDEEQKNEYLQLMWSTTTDTSVSDVHNMRPTSVYNRLGYMPEKHCYFVTSTAAGGSSGCFAASGNQFIVKGYYESVV